MGTRADFYFGNPSERLDYLGSIAYDGHEETMLAHFRNVESSDDYIDAVNRRLKSSDGFRQWPWTWANSYLTDLAYTYADGKILVSCFGSPWMPLKARVWMNKRGISWHPAFVDPKEEGGGE